MSSRKLGSLLTALFFLMNSLDLCYVMDSCGDRDFCAGAQENMFFGKNCFCDPKCLQYGDCCEDAPILKGQTQSHPSKNLYKCVQIDSTASFGYQMIGWCPNNWPMDEIRHRCHYPNKNSKFYTALPLTDLSTNITYQNSYCAACHNIAHRYLTPWKLNIKCEANASTDKIKDLKYNSINHVWELIIFNNSKEIHLNCSTLIEIPDGLTSSRNCYPNVVSTCLQSWKNVHLVRRLCYERTAYRFTTHYIYKNIFCAICNNELVDFLHCSPKIIISKPLHRPNTMMNHNILSYSVFLRGALDYGENSRPCPEGQIQDHTENCVEFFCSRDMIMLNGACVEM